MAKIHSGVSRRKKSFRGVLLTSVFLGTSVLGACSSVPDAVNPVEWYKGTVDLFAGDKKEAKEGDKNGLAADRGKAPPGSEKPFPNLASVDRQARARDQKGGGLSADAERPKYAPSIRRQGESTEAPAAPRIASAPKSVAGATMPPPPAVPTKTVTAVPVARPAPVPAPVLTAQKAPQMPKTIPKTAPKTMPKLAPPNLTVDQQATEERLARQLAEIRAQAKIAAAPTLRAPKQALSGEQDTIVISSDGVETLAAMATQMAARAETSPVTQRPPASQTGSRLAETTAQPLTGTVTKIATIMFDNGSSRLRADDKRILSAVKRLQVKQGGTLRIVGHASTRTRNMSTVKHMMTNFKISIARADRVVSELVRLGLKKENIEVAAVSDREPLYYETMPSGEAGNRRTEIFLIN